MENYKLFISSSAQKSLSKIPKMDLIKITLQIQKLSIDPQPIGCRKLQGEEFTYRIRVGKYRIIYEINNKEIKILILKIGHRKDIYKK